MKGYGIGLAIVGVLLAIAALIMGSTVPQEVPYSVDFPSLTRTQEMHNLPRAQLQLLLFVGGCALFVGGVILGAIGQIETVLLGQDKPADSETTDAAPVPPQPVELTAEETAAQAAAEEQSRLDQERWAEQSRVAEKRFIIGAVVLVMAFLAFMAYLNFGAKPLPRTDAAAAAVENLEMTADNLEAEAIDNLTEIDAGTR